MGPRYDLGWNGIDEKREKKAQLTEQDTKLQVEPPQRSQNENDCHEALSCLGYMLQIR